MANAGKFKLNVSNGAKKQVLIGRGLENEKTTPFTYRVTNNGPGEIYVETASNLLGSGEICVLRGGCSIDLTVGRSGRNLLWVKLTDNSDSAAGEYEFITQE